MAGVRRRKYLNNRDLQREIALSKLTYCEITDPEENSVPDLIINDINQISVAQIEEAKENRSSRLAKLEFEVLVNEGMTSKAANLHLDKTKLRPKDIAKEDLVIREMTFEHIPEEENDNGKIEYPRMKFPPFKQYRFKGKKWTEVVRSHWKGGFGNGWFDQEQGKLTDNLAKMIMTLVDRFSQKGNFRGYSYIEDMRGSAITHLVDVALKFDEAKSDNPFAFYTTICSNNFKGFLGTEKRIRTMRDDLRMAEGEDPSHGRMIDHEMEIARQELDDRK